MIGFLTDFVCGSICFLAGYYLGWRGGVLQSAKNLLIDLHVQEPELAQRFMKYIRSREGK